MVEALAAYLSTYEAWQLYVHVALIFQLHLECTWFIIQTLPDEPGE